MLHWMRWMIYDTTDWGQSKTRGKSKRMTTMGWRKRGSGYLSISMAFGNLHSGKLGNHGAIIMRSSMSLVCIKENYFGVLNTCFQSGCRVLLFGVL